MRIPVWFCHQLVLESRSIKTGCFFGRGKSTKDFGTRKTFWFTGIVPLRGQGSCLIFQHHSRGQRNTLLCCHFLVQQRNLVVRNNFFLPGKGLNLCNTSQSQSTDTWPKTPRGKTYCATSEEWFCNPIFVLGSSVWLNFFSVGVQQF